MEPLTQRELQVADLIHRGYIEKEIAEKLYLSPGTIHTYKKRLCQKLGARNIADITRIYILDLKRPMAVLTMFFALLLHGIATITTIDEMRRPQAMRYIRGISRSRKNDNPYILQL